MQDIEKLIKNARSKGPFSDRSRAGYFRSVALELADWAEARYSDPTKTGGNLEGIVSGRAVLRGVNLVINAAPGDLETHIIYARRVASELEEWAKHREWLNEVLGPVAFEPTVFSAGEEA